ncbi:MAG TPA: hypothetical protein VMD30_12145 [Tepidisphaeraceae bacterium]|nr:hypothetical protein [Tepidisphaeraceae bacterium]
MLKSKDDTVEVLGVCVDPPRRVGQSERLGFHAVQGGRRAVDMLRMLSYDFMLVGVKLPDMSVWDFLRHLRLALPHQKWALVGAGITDQQEINARMFGVTTIFDTTPTSHELLNLVDRLRERAAARLLAEQFGDAESGPDRSAQAM